MDHGLVCCNVGLLHPQSDGSEQIVLRGVDAAFRPGSISLVTGPTGSGKSSLLYILGGILRPTCGEVLAEGLHISRWTTAARDLWRRKVGMVFQSHHLLNHLTVLENTMIPMIPRVDDLNTLRTICIEALAGFGLDHMAGKSIATLSGGERQQVALVRAVVSQPMYLLADEPTAHQDAESLDKVLTLFLRAKAGGAAVVITSHDPRLMESGLADSHWKLHYGTLNPVLSGSALPPGGQ